MVIPRPSLPTLSPLLLLTSKFPLFPLFFLFLSLFLSVQDAIIDRQTAAVAAASAAATAATADTSCSAPAAGSGAKE